MIDVGQRRNLPMAAIHLKGNVAKLMVRYHKLSFCDIIRERTDLRIFSYGKPTESANVLNQ